MRNLVNQVDALLNTNFFYKSFELLKTRINNYIDNDIVVNIMYIKRLRVVRSDRIRIFGGFDGIYVRLASNLYPRVWDFVGTEVFRLNPKYWRTVLPGNIMLNIGVSACVTYISTRTFLRENIYLPWKRSLNFEIVPDKTFASAYCPAHAIVVAIERPIIYYLFFFCILHFFVVRVPSGRNPSKFRVRRPRAPTARSACPLVYVFRCAANKTLSTTCHTYFGYRFDNN